MNNCITLEQIFEQISRTSPEIITRKKLYEITGGLISVKYLANMDSEGIGIKPRLRIGGKIAYPKDATIAWLKQRCEIEGGVR